MSPDMPQPPRKELESSLTALLLGELSAEKADALRQVLAQDAELARLHDLLKAAIELVRQTSVTPAEQPAPQATPLKLSEGRRQKLLQHFKTVTPKEFERPRRVSLTLVELAAAAAMVLLLASLAVPNFVKSRTTSQANAIVNNLRQLDGAKEMWALEHHMSANDEPTLDDLKPYMKWGGETMPSIGGETYVVGKVGQPVSAEVDRSQAKSISRSLGSTKLPSGGRVRLYADGQIGSASGEHRNTPWQTLAAAPEPSSGANLKMPSQGDELRQPPESFTKRTGAIVSRAAAPGQVQTPVPSSGTPIVLPSESEVSGATAGTKVAGQPGESELVGVLEKPPEESGGQMRFYSSYQKKNRAPAPVPTTPAVGAMVGKGVVLPSPGGVGGGGGGGVTGGAGTTVEWANRQDDFFSDIERFKANEAPGLKFDAAESTAAAPVINPTTGLPERAGEVVPTVDPATGLPEPPVPTDSEGKVPNQLTWSGASAGTNMFTLDELNANQARFGVGSLASNQREPYSVNEVGFVNVPPNSNKFVPETTLALNDTSGKDVLRSKQGNVLLEDSVQQFSRARLQEALRNSADSSIAVETTRESAADSEKSRAYIEKKRELDELQKDSSRPIKLEAADLKDVMRTYGELVGRTPLRTGNLPPLNITLKSETPLTKSEAIQALDAALAQNGITAINFGGKFVKFEPVAIANSAGSSPSNEAGKLAEAGKYVTQVVPLKQVKPSEVAALLPPLTKTPNAVLPDDSSRILVLRDTPENIKRMLEIVSQRDAAAQPATKMEDAAPPKPPPTNAPIPQPEVQTCDNAFSTFSLNVSDVSFKLAGASLEKGVMPEAASVRSEEFINAFDYRDPEAPPGVPIAFAWERGRYPYAQSRDLLRFSLKTASTGRQAGRPLNLVLLLDNSGSMERADRVRIIHEALRVLASQLKAEDKLSVVTFARTARLWVDGVPGSEAGKVGEEVSGLTPQGGTNLEEAMNLAYQTALRHYLAGGVNRVVLLTDGAANLGNVEPEALKQKVESNRKQGIALDCFGIGWEGYNDDLLEVLSRNGDGRYGFINTPEEAATEFAGQLAGALRVAASDVKVQVEFNPNRVTAYRQIGYAKHQLTKEQFRDNTVDAAELGAAEAGNALYVVEVNPRGEGPLGTVRVRYKVPGTTDYHEHEWPVPYQGNAALLEQASPAMRLAATGSAFSEWLAASPYAGEVTLDGLLGYLREVPEVYGADGRPKKLEWMIRQAKSLAGK